MLILLGACSCFQNDDLPFESIESILDGKENRVHKGILSFRDQASFDKFVTETKDRTSSEWSFWELENNFKSLASIHEEIIEAENKFLEEMNLKYKGDESITRKEIGYTAESQKLLDDGILQVNEYETLDLNIPLYYYSNLLNKDGILRIGNDIHVPKSDYILVIKDLDMSKVQLSKSFHIGDDVPKGTEIVKVTRVFNSSIFNVSNEEESKVGESEGAKSMYIGSCDTNSSGYRLIVYDGTTALQYYGDGSFPCPNVTATYTVKLRSLKKVLGTWQNHQTSQWTLKSNFKADLFGKCYNGQPYFVRNIANYNNYYWTPIYHHTWDRWIYLNVPAGPCSVGGLDSCPNPWPYDDPEGLIIASPRQHFATGKGGTACYVGD